MTVVENVDQFLNAVQGTLTAQMKEWTEIEKEVFFSEFPYFLQRVYPERDYVLEGWRPSFLLAYALGAIRVINSLKSRWNQVFMGMEATGGQIGWRAFLPDGSDAKVSSIDTSAAASVPTWVDWIGTYSSKTVMRLSEYHGLVIVGVYTGTSKANKIDGFMWWDSDKSEYYKYFPENLKEVGRNYGVLFFPKVKYFNQNEAFGIQLRVTVKENIGKIPPYGLVIGLVDQYLSKSSPSW